MLAKQQHYVPRFLLKNFTGDKKARIWVFDKHTDSVFRTNIQNVAAENGFYNFQSDDVALSLEPGLAHLEHAASAIVSGLIKSKSLRDLTEESQRTLAYFLAVQFVRTKAHRLTIDSLQESVVAHLQKLGATSAEIEKSMGLPDDHSSKKQSLISVARASQLAPHFLNKTWMLFETKSTTPLYISDNPITLHNEQDLRPYGNLGLAVPGIEIYVPISTTMCLGLLSQTLGNQFMQAYDNFQLLDQAGVRIPDNALKDPSGAREFCTNVKYGKPNHLKSENVIMLNSLQVTFSSRFVYCETDSFDLVKQMIIDNSKFRHGLKPLSS